MRGVREIEITGDMVRLGQLLQLAGIADTGAHARALLDEYNIRVNGEPEDRRGRQLRKGDTVEALGETLRIG